ncbi:MAG TPA: flagellar motor switch protein FliN [Methylothermaceae bacterium]|nr:flagellar motor switch protein FliN [Methylothermaceae bacterium]
MSENEDLESQPEQEPEDQTETGSEEEALDDAWEEALAEQAQSGNADGEEDITPATYDSLEQEENVGQVLQQQEDNVNLDVILDIPVTLSMEIGRTRISIRNLLQLNQGSVVELDRLAGEPMDVLVNGTLIAHGEVVVVNDKFGIRFTDVISPAERVRRLR